jgi:hypothetical protein
MIIVNEKWANKSDPILAYDFLAYFVFTTILKESCMMVCMEQ